MSLIDPNVRINKLDLKQVITEFRRVLNYLVNDLTFADNMAAVLVTVADTGAADTDFTVTHNLGKIPTFYFANSALGGLVYDDSSGRAVWNSSTLVLRCSKANDSLQLWIL